MPLEFLKNINENITWGLWTINETSDELIKILHTKNLCTEIPNISLENKKCESLASRIVLKKIIESWGKCYNGIKKDEFNKPHMIGYDYHLSLSHTKNYATAIVHKVHETGIDIERVKDKVQRVAHKFLSDQELKDSAMNIKKLTLYWSAKEVLYKTYGRKKMSLKKHILIDDFELKEKGFIKGTINFNTSYYDKFLLAYSIINNICISYVYKRLTGTNDIITN